MNAETGMTKRHKAIFTVLIAGSTVSSLIQSALNTALTPIMADMGVTAATVQWLSSIYSLVAGIVILATAFLIRSIPTRRLYLLAMGAFTVSLLTAALSKTFAVLLCARILQAMGMGVLLSLAQVVILTIAPPERRGTMMGTYGLAVCAAPVIAPTLAGFIVDACGWHMIFWAAFVLAAVIWVLGFFVMENVLETERQRFDLLSMLLCAAGFTGVLLGAGNISKAAFLSVRVLGLLLAGAAALALFVWRQRRMDVPFLELGLLKIREYRLAVFSDMLLYAAMLGAGVLVPIYIQSMRGYSATVSGLVTMPGAVVSAVVSPIAGRMYDKMGIRRLTLAGVSLILAASVGLCFLGPETPLLFITGMYMIRSGGIGMLMMTTVTWGMSYVDRRHTSHGTAMLSSLRTLAGAFGAAVFTAVMELTADGQTGAAMIPGMNTAFRGLTCLVALNLLLAIFCIGRNRPGSGCKRCVSKGGDAA